MAIVRVILGEYTTSEAERKALEQRLDAIHDDEIDYTDMPPLTEKDWGNAITYHQFNKINHTVS